SPLLGPDLLERLIPGEALRALAVQLVQSLVEIVALIVRQGKSFRVPSQRVPELIEQLETLVGAKALDVNRRLSHGGKYATSPGTGRQAGTSHCPRRPTSGWGSSAR